MASKTYPITITQQARNLPESTLRWSKTENEEQSCLLQIILSISFCESKFFIPTVLNNLFDLM